MCTNSAGVDIKMETVLASQTSTLATSEEADKIKAASAPIYPAPSSSAEAKLTVQISAPSYLHSLKENEAPPFKKPEREARPKLLLGTIVSESDIIEIMALASEDSLQHTLGNNLLSNFRLKALSLHIIKQSLFFVLRSL